MKRSDGEATMTQFDRIMTGLALFKAAGCEVAYTYQEGLLVCVADGVSISPEQHQRLVGLTWQWCADYAGYYFPLSPL
jgi:hypothetical protein